MAISLTSTESRQTEEEEELDLITDLPTHLEEEEKVVRIHHQGFLKKVSVLQVRNQSFLMEVLVLLAQTQNSH